MSDNIDQNDNNADEDHFEKIKFVHPVTQKTFTEHCLLKLDTECFDFTNLNQFFIDREISFLVHQIYRQESKVMDRNTEPIPKKKKFSEIKTQTTSIRERHTSIEAM